MPPFTIIIDHHSLVHLPNQNVTTDIPRPLSSLWGYNSRWLKDNTSPDVMSMNLATNELWTISLYPPRWLETIVEGYLSDVKAQVLLQELSLANPNDEGYVGPVAMGVPWPICWARAPDGIHNRHGNDPHLEAPRGIKPSWRHTVEAEDRATHAEVPWASGIN
jgi:hypothetical protein